MPKTWAMARRQAATVAANLTGPLVARAPASFDRDGHGAWPGWPLPVRPAVPGSLPMRDRFRRAGCRVGS
jgi:hypothetical protein